MEISYTYLHSKQVVNVVDGKNLGRVCDVVFRYPENVFLGIVVPGSKGFSLKKGDVFIDVKQIACIGEDVVLVRTEGLRRAGRQTGKNAAYCRPSSAGNVCPPPNTPPCPPYTTGAAYTERRSFDEYE